MDYKDDDDKGSDYKDDDDKGSDYKDDDDKGSENLYFQGSLNVESSMVSQRGSSGQPVPVSANYLPLKGNMDGVFKYAVGFNPPVEDIRSRSQLLNEHKELIGLTRVFDGSTLYVPKRICEQRLDLMSTRQTDGASIKVTISLVDSVKNRDVVQLMNVIFKRILRSLKLQRIGRDYYDANSPLEVPQHKMQLWPGYVTAINRHEGGLMLVLDVSHRVMKTDTALDFLYELYHFNQDKFREEAFKQLVGSVVLTRYNNRTYEIDDIAWDKNPRCAFQDHAGSQITFVDYYKRAYDLDITDLEQPLLIHRPKKKQRGKQDEGRKEVEEMVCLVPELCAMTGLTDAARSDFKVMKDLAVHTRVPPEKRAESFRKFIQRLNTTKEASELLHSWGLVLDSRMLDMQGRRLPPEKILFKHSSIVANMEADWSRECLKEHVISAVSLLDWAVLFVRKDQGKATDFVNMLSKVCPPIGMEVHEPKMVEVVNDRTESYLRALRELIAPRLQMVVIVFPTSRDDRYSAVKKLCCIESPIPSQVLIARTITQQQKLRSVAQKVALQMNAKLGGELWAVEIPLKSCMVVGIDVYHDKSYGNKSIAGFVASTNPSFTRWYSRTAMQEQSQELIHELKLCMQAALKKYNEMNQSLPERIIVFRDGVGEGREEYVSEFEVPQFNSCFSIFGENYCPKLAVVVVQKRITTRIFGRSGHSYDNPPPGVIVDHTITKSYDFYLVSQHVRQGTVSPTYYRVIYDKSGLKPDHLQRLTYKLTHMYYNWPGTIRTPAPCKYAHKLAFLVGKSLHRDPAHELSDRLFFL
uniref:Piwi n=1 Tax=Ephydatia fluviatilis TaxID=31330 RepID=UPI002DDDBD8F